MVAVPAAIATDVCDDTMSHGAMWGSPSITSFEVGEGVGVEDRRWIIGVGRGAWWGCMP
jgi:hypothetical protein